MAAPSGMLPAGAIRPLTKSAWLSALVVALLAFAAVSFAAEADPAPAGAEPESAVVRHDFVFPRQRRVDGFDLVLHAPQIRAWPRFETFAAQMAVEIRPPDASPVRYATVTLQGATEVDLPRGVVRVTHPQVSNVTFSGLEPPAAYAAALRHAIRDGVLEIPVELFVAALANDVLTQAPPPGFNTAPPPIAVRSKPTVLLFVNGEPVGSPIAGTGLELIVNAGWPLFRMTGDKQRHYLFDGERWLESKSLDRGWKSTSKLPPDFARLPDEPQFTAVRAAVPPRKVEGRAPAVLYVKEPTELIVTDGRARFEEIPDTGGLERVTNTESQLFRLDDRWFYLASGRWFSTAKLDRGPWIYTPMPPDAFSRIPVDHAAGAVRASVPGTVEARMAALEAMLPTRVTAGRADAPPVQVEYAGEPAFEPIDGTTVARAVNSGSDVLLTDGRYYLLYAGIWYVGDAPQGPWRVAAAVPEAIYAIPPDSPSYHMTQVTIASATADTVTYSYPASYSTSTYVVYGVPYYGTGWYYHPWIWNGYYYPYWPSYGYGRWYNPATGGFGSRSVWYGPYGGYAYTQGYNPRTGRYGYVESAWDSDEWASHGETYNPRTGVGTETDRYYDADRNTGEMDRTVTRGDAWVSTERETDFDSGTSTVERETSRGGSSEITRQRSGDGVSSEGSITTGGGQQFDVSSGWSDGTRTSTVTGDSGSISTETRRQNGNSVTSIEGSGGGQGVSVKGDQGRTTVVRDDSGDIYAGHDGNVYKKTEGGWQEYENGGWQEMGGERRTNDSGAFAESRPAGEGAREPGGGLAGLGEPGQSAAMQQLQNRPLQNRPSTAELDRDYQARQRSQRQYEQRRAAQRGNLQRGGFRGMGGGMRGGGRRR